MSPLVPWMLGALLVVVTVAAQVLTAQSGSFPARLDSYLTKGVKLTGGRAEENDMIAKHP